MAKKGDFFKPEFDRLAVNGAIGDPAGLPAYGYARVSDDSQAEEGRSGLPRQIEHIHETAKKHGYRIEWNFLYCDDSSGFEFRDRPALTKLRKEYKHKRASAVVMEHLDRLSRDSDWHQGYLLSEMKENGLQPFFWKSINSRIERAVMGAIAQDGMEQAIARMAEGTRRKAQDGRITAKRAALGYRFVDSAGKEGTQESRRMTYYAIDQERAVCIEYIYDQIAYRGASCFELMKALDEKAKTDPRFAPPVAAAWNERSLVKLIRNPLYKGEYIANRFYKEKIIELDEQGQTKSVLKEKQRPESEWIRVEVPAIVSAEVWETAQKRLYKNKNWARRNKKNEYLLSGLVRCASCGWLYHGHTDSKNGHVRRYYCGSIHTTPGYRENHPCDNKSIHCDELDAAVWGIIEKLLLTPEHLAGWIEQCYNTDEVANMQGQIVFFGKRNRRQGE